MKEIDIPQEKNDAQDGQRKVMYAPNDNGEFKTFKYGSSVEEYATKLAVKEYEILKEEALTKIKNNISSLDIIKAMMPGGSVIGCPKITN